MSDTNTTATSPVAVVITDGGLRFTADIRGHAVPTDQPADAGGDDTAATPLELLAASLGACIALYAHQFCVKRGIPDDGLRVEVDWANAKAPYRISRFDVRVVLPESLPEQYRAPLERAVRTCPVHNTLSHPPELNVELKTPVGV
jgi:putative redox protein